MEGNVAELERRYKTLLRDYQAGRVDETTFISEVDKLQFKDDWGRYWMLGAQTGEWHYYDGQAWHRADPREADKLPFLDSDGRYWQKGIKSGDWYYYEAATGEWVKPNDGGMPGSFAPAAQPDQWPGAQTFAGGAAAGAAVAAGQVDSQLYQDDDGRYWAMGAKSNSWYFYDQDGWHPADEFQARTGSRAAQPQFYTPQQQTSPYQPAPDSRAAQVYGAPPAQGYAPQPQYPVYQPAAAYAQPAPPASAPGGDWYYHDGKQWLKYSSGEPAEGPVPDVGTMPDQKAEEIVKTPGRTEAKAGKKSETVVAEFFDDDDDEDIEVVDVEVIPVYDPVPEVEPEPAPAPQVKVEPEPEPEPIPAPIPTPEPARLEPEDRTHVPRRSDEIRPRRTSTAMPMGVTDPDERPLRKQTASRPSAPVRRTPADPSRPVPPRNRSGAHDPTIVIPTTPSGSPASPSSPTQTVKPVLPSQAEQRRARENTVPMEPIKPAAPAPTPVAREKTGPVTPPPSRHRQVTQELPKITVPPSPAPAAAPAPAPKTQTQPLPAAPPAKPAPQAKPLPAPVSAPVAEPVQEKPEEKEGYTLGDILRSFPSTLWTGIAGIAVLIIAAILIIAAVVYGGNLFGFNGSVAEVNPTPTLDSGLAPNTTPTPGPTAENSGPVNTPTPVTYASYSNSDLEIRLEYPDTWLDNEVENNVILAPETEGLIADSIRASTMRIGKSNDKNISISDLLSEVLGQFPKDAETLNEGTISIASQTWTSTQIRFDNEDLGGQGIATIAVTTKDGAGYYLIAAAPAQDWNSVQPLFQGVINSFEFVSAQELAKAQASPTARPTTTTAANSAAANEKDTTPAADKEEKAKATSTPTPTRTPSPTPTPEVEATPLVYAIQSGDTLLEIAVKFGVDIDLLAQENGIDDPASLQVGQELVIPYTAEELAAYNASNGADIPNPEDEVAAGDEENTDNANADKAAAAGDKVNATPEATEEPADEEPPTEAAPVSGRIIYPAFNPGTQNYDVWLVDLATEEQTPIAGNASQPDFNQDGSLIAYRSWDLGTRGIFFRDFVGGSSGIVTKFVEDALPAWSPDGFSFVFSSRKEGDRVPRLYIGNRQGTDTVGLGFQGEYPDTFPDGRIISRGCTPSGDCGIFTMSSRGGAEKKISSDPADTAPSVSPNGSKIAFMSSGRGARNWEIFVMDADGSNVTRLTENGNNDGLPTWSPDSQSIAYVSDQGGVWAVWVMNADGSNQRKLFNMKGSPDGKILRDESNSKGWLEERIAWAP